MFVEYQIGKDDCSQPYSNTTWNTGECLSYYEQNSMFYCSNDGEPIFQITYSDVKCTIPLGILELPTSCGFFAASERVVCVNPSFGPPLPFNFPPAGWMESISCRNASNSYKPATTCSSSDPSIHCYFYAEPTSTCFSSQYRNHTGFYRVGCNQDETAAGQAWFSDPTCSNLIGTESQPVSSCMEGESVFKCAGEAIPTLPAYGYEQYSDQHCSTGPNMAPFTFLFNPNVCCPAEIYSRMYHCEIIDGVQYGVLSSYFNQFQCNGNATITLRQQSNQCVNGKVFLCENEQKAIANW